MNKILITGFGPFLNHTDNPSQRVCEGLSKLALTDVELVGVLLPVAYHEAAQVLEVELKRHTPVAVLCLGLAAERAQIEIEKVALNFRDAIGVDNNQVCARNETIDPTLPASYFTTLPYEKMIATMKTHGVAAKLSLSAGSYVCNEVFFRLMALTEKQQIPAGFIHLPAQGDVDFLKVLPQLVRDLL